MVSEVENFLLAVFIHTFLYCWIGHKKPLKHFITGILDYLKMYVNSIFCDINPSHSLSKLGSKILRISNHVYCIFVYYQCKFFWNIMLKSIHLKQIQTFPCWHINLCMNLCKLLNFINTINWFKLENSIKPERTERSFRLNMELLRNEYLRFCNWKPNSGLSTMIDLYWSLFLTKTL